VSAESILNVLAALAQGTRDVSNECLAHVLIEHLVEKSTGLLVVIVGVHVRVSTNLTSDGMAGPGSGFVLNWGTLGTAWLVVDGELVTVTLNVHGTVTNVVGSHAGTVRAVNRDLLVVGSKSVTVGIGIVQETALQHLVHGWFNAWHQVGWSEGNLLSLSVVVSRVPVKGDCTNWDQGIITMGPDLGDIEDIESVVQSVFFWHGLNEPVPAWVVTFSNSVVEVVSSPLGILDTLFLSFLSGEVFDALSGFVVVLDVVNFVLVVHPSEGVGRVAVHVTVAIRGTTVREQNEDLVKSLGRVGPEVEGGVGVLQVVNWVALLGVDEIGELDGVLNKEDWGVIADHVVVAFFSVMLDGEATWVTVAVICTALTSNG